MSDEGTAYLTVKPTSPSLRTIYLNASPLLEISSVLLSSPTDKDPLLPTPATYAFCNPFQPLPNRDPPVEISSHPEIKRRTWAATGEGDEGELAISVSGGWVRIVQVGDHSDLGVIQIQIDYSLTLGGKVVEGIVFERDEIPHMFLSPTTYDAARVWTPCVDNLWERSTWEFEFIVPSFLEGGEDSPVMVVSSGELQEQVTHPHNPHKTIFHYLQTNICSVQQISFAAGPFELVTIVPGQRPVLGFCLPGDMELMLNTTSFLSRAMAYYTTEFGTYPLSDFKIVFVTGPRIQCSTAATIAVISSDLLHPFSVIDEAVTAREILSLSLIQQWVGINIIPKTVADTWLINGLALYLRGLFLRHLLGNNEYRYRLKKDIDKCARLDQGDHMPLCVPGTLDLHDLEFVNLKAPLVLHILDRNLVKAGTSVGLTRVVPRIFLTAFSDDLPGNMLSTSLFFRTCRKVSSIDLTAFQDLWVYGSGCPNFKLQANFIRKKFLIDLSVQQSQPAVKPSKIDKRPTKMFEGTLAVRIHEADGAPFEHLLDIKVPSKQFSLPFNTKYKRTRRSGHIAARYSKLREDLAAAETDADKDEAAKLRDADRAEVFAYPPWDDDAERERWRVAEWTDDEVEAMMGEGGGYEWIRFDPECEWIATFDFAEKPWYWISQLQGDRDVIAQVEAIQNLTMYPSPVVASELARTILVKNYFYRVRMEAAKALTVYNTSECDYIGHFLLVKLYRALFCLPGDDDAPIRPKRNDFSDVADYLSLVSSLADLRDPATRNTRRDVRRLLLDLIRYNDNTGNLFDDSNMRATYITALGNAFSLPAWNAEEVDRVMFDEANEAVDRAITMDRLAPSFHNSVTIAGLLAQMKMILGGKRTNDPRNFLSHTREGNFEPVRLTAFDCLLLCRRPGRSSATDTYLAEVIKSDSSLTVRRHVARGLSESILMALAVNEIKANVPAGVQEMNNESAREQSAEKMFKPFVDAVRDEYETREDVKHRLKDLLIDDFAGLDQDVRLALIKMCEIIGKSVKERPPGPTITLSTPAVETPAIVTPRIRLSIGGPDVKTEDYGFPATSKPTITLPLQQNKKKGKVLKSQSQGLPETDLKAIENALQKLNAHRSSYLFRQPVDPIRENVPTYLDIIRKPMDLSTIRARLDNGMYTKRTDFVEDVKLIISNCYTFNGKASPVGKVCQDFEAHFNKLWSRTEATLSSASAGSTPSITPLAPPLIIQPYAPSVKSEHPKAEGIKLTVKPPRPPQSHPPVLPMAPPPVPVKKRTSEHLAVKFQTPPGRPPKESKPRKPVGSTEIDDLLGQEVDAMEQRPSIHPSPTISFVKPTTTMKPPPIITLKPSLNTSSSSSSSSDEPKMKKAKITTKSSPEKTPQTHTTLHTPPLSSPIIPKAPKQKPVPPLPPPPPPAVDVPGALLPIATRQKPPSNLPQTVGNPMPFRLKRAKALLAALKKPQEALIFARPVNPIADGCPTYLDEIKEPMDLGTITKKMDGRQYTTMGALAYDIELVFNNCWQFNPPGPITVCADTLERVYWQEWSRVVNPKMTADERKAMSALLAKSMKEQLSLFFREPVDPVALQIPNYFEIIPPEDARDLSTIKSNVEKGKYATARDVDEDVELMLENARVFNGDGIVVEQANAFGRWWRAQRNKSDL
ncbi:hypothetical protein M231_06358 [Tremella mesenterica]|uniref:Transcription initiation factor TFIID subunit 2 n=1 Tax=Tremella mesenterica TaxID=5217 RepID=A0A4Q1BC37_TREME|nr:hypothetical protein M231_06358 [Tremella mesenterica]